MDEVEEYDGLEDGMDPEGFSGPSIKIVKPLTKEALAEFQAIQDRAGIIYVSRIPPGMRPTKVRHLMSAYGEIGRVYLQQEGIPVSFSRVAQHSILQTQSVHIYDVNIHLRKNLTSRKDGSNSKIRKWRAGLLTC